MVRRRAFSLVELLCVTAILAVLAALLFPTFARSKARAKIAGCQSRLRGFAVALNLYRADHDDLGFRWTTDLDRSTGYRYPYNEFEPMKRYVGDGSVLWCPEPNADPKGTTAWNGYAYRTWVTDVLTDRFRVGRHRPFKPVPGSVVVWCANHTVSEQDPRYAAAGDLRKGVYPYVREDTSMGLAKSEALTVAYYSSEGWFDTPKWPRMPMLRFPGEPWPPIPEE